MGLAAATVLAFTTSGSAQSPFEDIPYESLKVYNRAPDTLAVEWLRAYRNLTIRLEHISGYVIRDYTFVDTDNLYMVVPVAEHGVYALYVRVDDELPYRRLITR